jgi:hypothetical protein
MYLKTRQILFTLLAGLALTLSACGSSASNDSIIATSVAMTVQAQNTQEAVFTPTSLPTLDIPTPFSTPTPGTTRVPPTAPPTGSGVFKPCYSANYISETIPDGTIVSPGQTYWKSWHVLNSGSCAWDSNFKFVFMDGDIMGGAYVYNFPGAAAPGQEVDIPIQLVAPQVVGTYTGNWKIEAPDKTIFGVGQYDTPLSVKVVVAPAGTPSNHKTASPYAITNVTIDVTRECKPANTFYTITASLTSNGPISAVFTENQSDGHNTANRKITFTEATTLTRSWEWSQGIASSTNTRWVSITITSPEYHEWPKVNLPPLCGH